MRLTRVLAAAGVALFALASQQAASQSGRTVRIVVPFPAGGTADDTARIVADQVGRTRGTNFVIENRPGAGTILATEAVSRAAPDGSTLLIVSNSFVINPSVKKLNYDPLTSFAPVCHLVSSPLIFAVHSASPYQSLAALVAAAKAKPGGRVAPNTRYLPSALRPTPEEPAFRACQTVTRERSPPLGTSNDASSPPQLRQTSRLLSREKHMAVT